MLKKDSHCSFCGHHFEEKQTWPRTCGNCRKMTFRNPIPVVVLLQPVEEGVLLVRRAIEPCKGELALPGGYVGWGESWQEAGVRELFEETGIVAEASNVREFRVRSTPDGRIVLIFGQLPTIMVADIPPFTPNEEVLELVITREACDLAFALHTEVLKAFFESALPTD